jgi:hypothetical protein
VGERGEREEEEVWNSDKYDNSKFIVFWFFFPWGEDFRELNLFSYFIGNSKF